MEKRFTDVVLNSKNGFCTGIYTRKGSRTAPQTLKQIGTKRSKLCRVLCLEGKAILLYRINNKLSGTSQVQSQCDLVIIFPISNIGRKGPLTYF